MADPLTIFAATAQIISGISAARGALYAGRSENAAQEFNALVEESYADVLQLEAVEQARRLRRENRLVLGNQVARRAASGVDISTGSPLLVQAESAARLELQVLESNRQFANQATQARTRAISHRFSGANAKQASKSQAGTSLLTSAASAASLFI